MMHSRRIAVRVDNRDEYAFHVSRDLTWNHFNSDRSLAKLEGEWAPANNPYDEQFIARIKSFADSIKDVSADRGPIWGEHIKQHQFIFDWLAANELEQVHDHLNHLHISPLMHLICSSWGDPALGERNPKVKETTLLKIWDTLLSVCEYVGVAPKQNIEQGPSLLNVPVDVLVSALDLTPPRFQGAYYALKTSSGLFTDRSLMSLYAALRVDNEYGGYRNRNVDMPIVEIGGGGGYVAYWLRQLGYRNITLVDLPTVLICQAYQLGANYGNKNICLPHEDLDRTFKFLTPELFLADTDTKYELVINCDSMAEMSETIARDYLRHIDKRANRFFSMNQETGYDQRRVLDDVIEYNNTEGGGLEHTNRSMTWVREGYTDDWFTSHSEYPKLSHQINPSKD